MLFNNVSDINHSNDSSSFLIFYSDPSKMCSKRKREKYMSFILNFQMPLCATLQTTVNLNTKLLTKRKTFVVGLQKFENAKINYYPDASIKLTSNKSILLYNWIPYENVKCNKNKYKLLYFSKLKYSWIMAEAKFQEYGMALLHLENERRPRELVSFIFHEYTLPSYIIFIGLVRKVRSFC